MEELFELFDGDAHAGGPTVRTRGGALDLCAKGEEFAEVFVTEAITGFDSGFACHHVDDFMERFFFGRGKWAACGPFEEILQEIERIDAALEQERRKRANTDGVWREPLEFDAAALEERAERLDGIDVRWGRGVCDGREESLAFEWACRQSLPEAFVHDTFVQCVLIDDDEAYLVLGHDVRVVNLQCAVSGPDLRKQRFVRQDMRRQLLRRHNRGWFEHGAND